MTQSIYLPADLKAAVDSAAKDARLSRSAMIALIIREWKAAKKGKA
jgi:predicted transcriptional regulator